MADLDWMRSRDFPSWLRLVEHAARSHANHEDNFITALTASTMQKTSAGARA
jgi:hypothetical protein